MKSAVRLMTTQPRQPGEAAVTAEAARFSLISNLPLAHLQGFTFVDHSLSFFLPHEASQLWLHVLIHPLPSATRRRSAIQRGQRRSILKKEKRHGGADVARAASGSAVVLFA